MKSNISYFFLVVILALVINAWFNSSYLKTILHWKIVRPYAMLWLSDREENRRAWELVSPDIRVTYPAKYVPEIQAKDYNFEVIREATNNFRTPAVVRGLFKNSIAVEKWKTPGHMAKKFGNFTIPIVRNAVVGSLQDDRVLVNFEKAFTEMLSAPSSKEYLFFPVKSRFTFNGSEEGSNQRLQELSDEICREDLNLDLIWPGFSGKGHKNFAGSQFVIGKSTPSFSNETTGSDWHCAIGNNWFVLVTGRKKWEFVEPKYSHYMSPLKGGMFNMWTGNSARTKALQAHIPVWTLDMEEGDLLYNPDWMWHKVTNYGGLSIGVPIRERNLTLGFRNNPYFSSIVASSVLLSKFGLSLGGYPPPNAATEQDN